MSKQLAGALDTARTMQTRVGTLESRLATSRTVKLVTGIDSSLITGSIGMPLTGFTGGDTGKLPPKPGKADATPTPGVAEINATAPVVPTEKAVESVSPPAALSVAAPATGTAATDAATTDAPTSNMGAIVPLPLPRPAGSTTRVAAPATPATTSSAGRPGAIGIAVGNPVTDADASTAWEALKRRTGPLVSGMAPLLAEDPSGRDGKVLVAGPIESIGKATTLCANFDRAGIACMPMPYVGTALPTGKAGGTPSPKSLNAAF